MTIDVILKTIRLKQKISQETFARELNVSYATLNRWENNKSKPSRLAKDKLIDYCLANEIDSSIVDALKNI